MGKYKGNAITSLMAKENINYKKGALLKNYSNFASKIDILWKQNKHKKSNNFFLYLLKIRECLPVCV